MDTKQLVAFCAVIERRSFSQAADQLGVTQPAVSLQIRSLEQRVGQRLLDRSGRRVEPTEAGLRLYRGAQRLLAMEQQLLAELGDEAEGELKGRLEIGASTGPGGSVLPVVLGEFQRLHPQVHVTLTVADTPSVVKQVARREVDLAAGTLALVRVEGIEPAREVQLARATGRAETRVAQAFVAYARERLK